MFIKRNFFLYRQKMEFRTADEVRHSLFSSEKEAFGSDSLDEENFRDQEMDIKEFDIKQEYKDEDEDEDPLKIEEENKNVGAVWIKLEQMITCRARDAQVLETLYENGQEDESSEMSESETDDNIKSESSHASETDVEDDSEEETIEREAGQQAGTSHHNAEPPPKRDRPGYLHTKSGVKWSLNAPKPRDRRSQYIHKPAVKGNAVNAHAPIEAWSCLLSDDILEIIVKHTNEEIDRNIRDKQAKNIKINLSCHKHIDLIELKACIGLLYYAGMHKMIMSKTVNWWSVHSMPLFKATISHNRFTFILQNLRFDDKNTRPERKLVDRFANIREIWNLFISNCKDNYEPDSNCTIDEQLLSFRGRCSFKIHIPSKPDKYGIKIVSMNDAVTHYMINAMPYVDTIDRDQQEPVPSYYVRKLSEPIHNTERNITCDNWFMSYSLVESMGKNYNTTIVGTMKKNKREIPDRFKKIPANKSNVQFGYTNGKTLVSYNPKNKKIVLLLSSLHYTGKIDTETGKPEIVVFYNKTKGGTDTFDFKCHQYTVARKTFRWPLRLFYGMLDQASVNSFVLYNINEGNELMKRLKFMFELSLALVKPFLIRRLATPTLRLKLRNMIEDFLEAKDLPEDQEVRDFLADNKMPKQKRCGFCPSALDRKTYYKCLQCDMPMCREHVAKICCECSSVRPEQQI
ncbi:piggyBac transposable element-derived protein 4 isoform X1 [Monomorium pharaonis]|uniref:piggyBac transposable element-derived protein 4 isoform X1 n=2 Tax=Monomorium pharaonis TaxID=307658 RepID=UPI001746DD30|nr:piggyBac transposable element-derived protein 4 isoform X1 [Monomorium pharaonis]